MRRAGLWAPVVLLTPLLLLLGSTRSLQADGLDRDILQDPLAEWERVVETGGAEAPDPPATPDPKPRLWRSSDPEPRRYPEYVAVSQEQTALFKPEKGSRAVPESIRKILLSPGDPAGPGADRAKQVEVLCHVDRIYVRVQRVLFQTRDAFKHLKLGRCPVNQGTKEHFYLLHQLQTPCGFRKTRDKDFLIVSIDLVYDPDSPVLREVPFKVTLQCKFPRFFHSYKVGFLPRLQGGTVYRALASRGTFSLTPQDASGKDVLGSRTFTLGQLMHFAARGPISSEASRIYIQQCYMTTSPKADATPRHTVIDNQGCMVEGKVAPQAAFLKSDSPKVQRFRVAVFIFRTSSSSSSQLYMHCQLALGPRTATPSAKACNYHPASKTWKELYGLDSVCSCCESRCPAAPPKASRAVISSQSWKVGGGDRSLEAELQLKTSGADLEEADRAEHLTHWDDD